MSDVRSQHQIPQLFAVAGESDTPGCRPIFLEDPVWLRAGVCFVEFHEMGRGHGNLIEHCVDKT
jgi:hypothetical protein